jgi:3-hydroxyisobutyrate dehydrogenase-like beta-hydroxyacid dehydrogenase
MSDQRSVGFIGVGKMGLPMATHLAAAGHRVSVTDTDETRLQLAQLADLRIADSLETAITGRDVVFSSLPNDEALLQVSQRLCRSGFAGMYVDTSTVSPVASSEVAKRCKAAGIEYLRVTLSGNNHMAQAAQLTVLASGPRSVYERVQPLLETFGPTRFWLGEAEQSRLMKLVVNLMIGLTSGMLAEALALGRKGGLAAEDLWAVIGASAVASPIVKAKAVQLSKRDFTPTFTVLQMIKDLDLIVAAGNASHVPLPLTALLRQTMHSAAAQGFAHQDYAAVIKVLERAAGLPDL